MEFLKGPASVLYGASGALSGLVNIVTKTPKSRDFVTLEATGGAPAYGRGTIDGNVRLSDTLDSRTNLAITRDTVLNAFRPISERFAMQSFRWHPGDLSIIAEGSYFHANGPSREATQYPELQRFFDLPKSFKTGERWDRNINTGYGGRLDASWRVTPNLTLRQGVNYQHYREDDHDTTNYDGTTFDHLLGPDLLGRGVRRGIGRVRYVVSQSELRWNFALGSTRHKLLAGFEYGDERQATNGLSFAPIAPLDLNDPVYGASEPDIPITDFGVNTIRGKAFYLQDFIEWGQLPVDGDRGDARGRYPRPSGQYALHLDGIPPASSRTSAREPTQPGRAADSACRLRKWQRCAPKSRSGNRSGPAPPPIAGPRRCRRAPGPAIHPNVG